MPQKNDIETNFYYKLQKQLLQVFAPKYKKIQIRSNKKGILLQRRTEKKDQIRSMVSPRSKQDFSV